VKVDFHATLRPIVGGKTVEIPFEPAPVDQPPRIVRDLMQALVGRWPDLHEYVYDERGGLSRQVAIYLDGRNVRWLEGEETAIESGQRIAIFPPVAGG
jgi:molybdopterin synthase sulfur carrier subunit